MLPLRAIVIAAFTVLLLNPASAAEQDIDALHSEIENLRQAYEQRINELETKLIEIEAKQQASEQETVTTSSTQTNARRSIFANSHNPSIGIILNGTYSHFSSDEADIAGFAVGEEGERGREGLSLNESELNFSGNIDDKFFGHLTTAIVQEDGESKLELEEAFFQTLPGTGLPFSIKAGRAFWTIGYLNEHHMHSDDFADRPLPYRIYLNKSFNDDGLELSYVLPTDLYAEIGAGIFRGDDFPFGNASGSDIGAWSAYARIGGDIGSKQSWRLGGSVLSGDAAERSSNEDSILYSGDTDLYVADFRYTWSPNGNPRQRELTLQTEYFWRDENGIYTVVENDGVNMSDTSSGWYAQAVYKFHPQWRFGGRYSQMLATAVPDDLRDTILDPAGHDPVAYTIMLDWSHSEFSRLRLQYNYEELANDQDDHQILLQYIMSFGAHGTHKY